MVMVAETLTRNVTCANHTYAQCKYKGVAVAVQAILRLQHSHSLWGSKQEQLPSTRFLVHGLHL